MKFCLFPFLLLSACASIPKPATPHASKIDLESIYGAAVKFSDRKCKSQKDCGVGFVCMNDVGENPKCIEKPKGPERVFSFPFTSGSQVVCTQSYGNLKGTHGWPSAMFALDLATPYDQPAGKIVAVAPGVAYVSNSCANPSGPPAKLPYDRCGNGWGNNIRIDHGNGLISLYAHLSQVFVKTGDRVEERQIIGVEGASGAAGHRHLHFDIQQIPGDSTVWQEVFSLPDVNGLSIPYQLQTEIKGKPKVLNSSEVSCKWGDMNQQQWRAP